LDAPADAPVDAPAGLFALDRDLDEDEPCDFPWPA
jgi:hypothetical protein